MNEIPYNDELARDEAEPRYAPDGPFIEPTRERVRRVWWAFFWPQLLAMVVIAFASGPVETWLSVHGYLSAGQLKFALRLAGIWFWSTIMLGAMDYALGRSFREFRVALVPATAEDVTPLRRTFGRIARVTWGYLWRVWVLKVIFGLIVLFWPSSILHASSQLSPGPMDAIETALDIALTAAIGLYVFRDGIVGQVFGDARVALLPLR
jgi:hypothetical protein